MRTDHAGHLRQLLARLPADRRALLTPAADCTQLRATCVTDPVWLSEQIRLRGLIWGIGDRHVLATLWWYSASAALVRPSIAALASTGLALSARLEDIVLHHTPSSRFTGSHSTATTGTDLDTIAAQLRESLEVAINAVRSHTTGRPRPLWALAADAICTSALWVGEAIGRPDPAWQLADSLIRRLGAELPAPRPPAGYGSQPTSGRVSNRVSCCLLYRVPDQGSCARCPRNTSGSGPAT